MQLVEFTVLHGEVHRKIAIPISKITGFCHCGFNTEHTFIGTGADGEEGAENGWVVTDNYESVKEILEAVTDDA